MDSFIAVNGGCFPINSKDDILINKVVCLIDNENRTVVDNVSNVVIGHTYTAKVLWKLTKKYTTIKYFETEYEAQKSLDDIVCKLSENSNVVIVD